MALPPHVLLAMSRQEQKRKNRRDINKAIGTVAPIASTAAGLVSAYNDGSYNPSVGLGAAAGAVQGGASALSSGAGIFGALGFGALGAVTGAITSLNQKEKMYEQEQNRTNNRLYSSLVGNDIGLQEIMEAKKGGQAVPSEDAENPEQQMYIPVQTEADEMMAFADGSLQEVHATKKHSEMKKDHVTDVVPIGTYIFPESVKLSKKDLESLITYSVGDYSENGQDYKIQEVKLTTILGDKFEGSFADAARVIKRKYPVTVDKRGINGITDKSNDENMKHRLTYINHLIRLNEAKLNKEKVEDNKIIPSMMAKKGGYADIIQSYKAGGGVDPIRPKVLIDKRKEKYQKNKPEPINRYSLRPGGHDSKIKKVYKSLVAPVSKLDNRTDTSYDDPNGLDIALGAINPFAWVDGAATVLNSTKNIVTGEGQGKDYATVGVTAAGAALGLRGSKAKGIGDKISKFMNNMYNPVPSNIIGKKQVVDISDFNKDNEYYRVVVGDDAFNDIVQTGTVRTKSPVDKVTNKEGLINLDRRGTTPYPSFSKGKASIEYAKDNPNNYIVVTADESIKPSTSGRHGKGTTMFPTSSEGKHLKELAADKVKVYKHIGDGKYELVDHMPTTPKMSKGGFASMIQHFKKGGDVDPKPKKKTVVGNNFDIILPETGPNIWSTPLQKQNVIIDKGEPTTPAAVGNTPSTPVPTNKKPTPSQKIVPTRPSWTPNKIPVRPKPSNSNLASRGADGRTVEIQKDKPISNADLLSSFLNKRPMVYSNSSITNKQRNKSYNDDVQDRLSLLYNSDEFKNASKFEQLGMMTEIDPISLFQEGLVTGISSIPIGRAFTALEKANNSYILKPAQAILKGKGSKNIKGWDSFFKKNGGYARLIQEAPRRYAAGSFVSGPGDPPKGKRYSNKKRGDFIVGEDGKGYLKVGDKWNPVSQQTYDAFSKELKDNQGTWAQINNQPETNADMEVLADPMSVTASSLYTPPDMSNSFELIKSMFPRQIPQPKYSNRYGVLGNAPEFDPRLPIDETGIPKYQEIKGATQLQEGKSGLLQKPTSVISDDQNPYGYNEESGVGEYIGNMRPDSIPSLVADATQKSQNADSTNNPSTTSPFDEANDMLDMRAQDAQYDAQVSRENYSDLFDRMGNRDTAQLITALGGLGLQDRTETANLKSPYYLAQKNQKFTAQEIKARQDATVGVGMEGLKQLGRTGEMNMAANLAPVVYSQLIGQGSEIGENLSTYNKQQDQKYYNELGQIRTANDTEMARVQNVERDNNNKYIAGTTGTITEFMASRNDRDIDQVKVNEDIERDLTRKIYAVQNQKFDLKFRQMDYEDQMKDIETQRESLKAQVEEFAKTQNLPEGQKEKMLTRLESEYAALVQQMKIMQALSPTPKK
jgi:hypothetical protein